MAADPLDIVTLAEARAFLNLDAADTSEDDELQSFITAITDVVEGEVGPVVQRNETAIIRHGGTEIPAPAWPISSVVSGAYLDDDSSVDVTALVADGGVIFTKDGTGLPCRAWTMTYQAGRSSVPDGIKKGALEILKLAWATQRGKEAPAFLIPYRAAAWFKPYASSMMGFA